MIPPLGKSDRLLRRFCRTGDPRALGALFDRTAPELLRAAIWLCGNKTDAEDLLQRTFVTVIEARGNYDPARRALPWLCGILGKHAKKVQDKRAREVDHHRRLAGAAAAPSRSATVVPVHSPAAADVAAEREMADRIAELRGGLGSPYREVLDLYLGRGLKPDEIAELLQREPATVRTQLARGMAKLRERIPLTLFSPVVALALVTPESVAGQLAPIRGAILRQAGATADIAAATLTGKPALAVIAATAMLSVAALAIWTGLTERTPASVPEVAVLGRGPESAADSVALEAALERQLLDTPPPRTPQKSRAVAVRRVSGRVVDAHGQAVPHAILWLSDRDKAIEGSDHGTCDATGSFELDVDGSRYLGARHAGHVGSYLHWLGTSDAEPITLQLRGQSGAVPGRVFDATGEPLGGATIEFGLPGGWRVTNSTHERAVYPPRCSGRTDASGSFEVDGIEPGRVDLLVRADGHSPLYGEAVVAPGGNAALVFRLQRGGTVSGQIKNEHGGAVGGAVATASDEHGEVARASSDADGRYTLADLPMGSLMLTAGDGTATTRHELSLSTGASSRWDPVLQASGSLAGRVVDRQQRPVAGIQVLAGPPTMRPGVPAATTGADGSFRLSVAGRSVDLFLRSGGAPLAVRADMRGAVAHSRGGTADEVVVELLDHELPNASISGRILDREGRPVAAALSVMHHGYEVAWYEFADPLTGRFRADRLAAGSYTLIVEAAGFGRTPVRVAAVSPGEHRAMSDLHLEAAGRVELELLAGGNRQRKVIKFARDDGAIVGHAISDDARVTAELPPGRYAASVFRGDYAGSTITLTVRRGETTHCTLPCAETARLALRLSCPATDDGTRIDVRILDAAGNFFDAYEAHVGRDPVHLLTVGLPVGRYRIECRAADGRAGDVTVSVHATSDRRTIDVELR